MNIHEYQAKQLLAQYGVAVPPGEVCDTPEAAKKIAEELVAKGATMVVVKSQIHAGGRGKGTFKSGFKGGVKLCKTADEVFENAKACWATCWSPSKPAPKAGSSAKFSSRRLRKSKRNSIWPCCWTAPSSRPVMMASTEGGMDIEEVAAKTPEKIVKETIDPAVGMMPYQARKIAAALGFKGDLIWSGREAAAGRL